jgi:hypothetical protein
VARRPVLALMAIASVCLVVVVLVVIFMGRMVRARYGERRLGYFSHCSTTATPFLSSTHRWFAWGASVTRFA